VSNSNSPDKPASGAHPEGAPWLNSHLDGMTYSIFPKGTVVFREHEAGDYAYLIKSGSVIIQIGPEDSPRIVDKLGEDEFFGEMALIDDEPRSATAVAEENLICAVFTREEIQGRIQQADFYARPFEIGDPAPAEDDPPEALVRAYLLGGVGGPRTADFCAAELCDQFVGRLHITECTPE
jgi:hypothetical protein